MSSSRRVDQQQAQAETIKETLEKKECHEKVKEICYQVLRIDGGKRTRTNPFSMGFGGIKRSEKPKPLARIAEHHFLNFLEQYSNDFMINDLFFLTELPFFSFRDLGEEDWEGVKVVGERGRCLSAVSSSKSPASRSPSFPPPAQKEGKMVVVVDGEEGQDGKREGEGEEWELGGGETCCECSQFSVTSSSSFRAPPPPSPTSNDSSPSSHRLSRSLSHTLSHSTHSLTSSPPHNVTRTLSREASVSSLPPSSSPFCSRLNIPGMISSPDLPSPFPNSPNFSDCSSPRYLITSSPPSNSNSPPRPPSCPPSPPSNNAHTPPSSFPRSPSISPPAFPPLSPSPNSPDDFFSPPPPGVNPSSYHALHSSSPSPTPSPTISSRHRLALSPTAPPNSLTPSRSLTPPVLRNPPSFPSLAPSPSQVPTLPLSLVSAAHFAPPTPAEGGSVGLLKETVVGKSVSSYPLLDKEANLRAGDPICDHYEAKVYKSRKIFAVADGCNWGTAPQKAARLAAQNALRVLDCDETENETVLGVAYRSLRAIMVAHTSIFEKELNPEDAGGTTLIAGMIVQIAGESDPDKEWVVVMAGVGDCKAFLCVDDDPLAIDLTSSNRSHGAASDSGGRIGFYRKNMFPDLRNLHVTARYCRRGSSFYGCSDGVHDNLDPEHLGLSPLLFRSILQKEEIKALCLPPLLRPLLLPGVREKICLSIEKDFDLVPGVVTLCVESAVGASGEERYCVGTFLDKYTNKQHKKFKTTVVRGSQKWKWNQKFTFDWKDRNASVFIQIYSKETFGDDLIGEVSFLIRRVLQGGGEDEVKTKMGVAVSQKWKSKKGKKFENIFERMSISLSYTRNEGGFSFSEMGMEEEGEGENKEGQWRGLGEAFLDVVMGNKDDKKEDNAFEGSPKKAKKNIQFKWKDFGWKSVVGSSLKTHIQSLFFRFLASHSVSCVARELQKCLAFQSDLQEKTIPATFSLLRPVLPGYSSGITTHSHLNNNLTLLRQVENLHGINEDVVEYLEKFFMEVAVFPIPAQMEELLESIATQTNTNKNTKITDSGIYAWFFRRIIHENICIPPSLPKMMDLGEGVDNMLSHCLYTTRASRHFMETKPRQKLPSDYVRYPGKMDHTTLLALSIPSSSLSSPPFDFSPRSYSFSSTTPPPLPPGSLPHSSSFSAFGGEERDKEKEKEKEREREKDNHSREREAGVTPTNTTPPPTDDPRQNNNHFYPTRSLRQQQEDILVGSLPPPPPSSPSPPLSPTFSPLNPPPLSPRIERSFTAVPPPPPPHTPPLAASPLDQDNFQFIPTTPTAPASFSPPPSPSLSATPSSSSSSSSTSSISSSSSSATKRRHFTRNPSLDLPILSPTSPTSDFSLSLDPSPLSPSSPTPSPASSSSSPPPSLTQNKKKNKKKKEDPHLLMAHSSSSPSRPSSSLSPPPTLSPSLSPSRSLPSRPHSRSLPPADSPSPPTLPDFDMKKEGGKGEKGGEKGGDRGYGGRRSPYKKGKRGGRGGGGGMTVKIMRDGMLVEEGEWEGGREGSLLGLSRSSSPSWMKGRERGGGGEGGKEGGGSKSLLYPGCFGDDVNLFPAVNYSLVKSIGWTISSSIESPPISSIIWKMDQVPSQFALLDNKIGKAVRKSQKGDLMVFLSCLFGTQVTFGLRHTSESIVLIFHFASSFGVEFMAQYNGEKEFDLVISLHKTSQIDWDQGELFQSREKSSFLLRFPTKR